MSKTLFKQAILKPQSLTEAEVKLITGKDGLYIYEECEFRTKDGSTLRLRDHLSFGQPVTPDNASNMKGRVKVIEHSRVVLPRIVNQGDDFQECNLFYNDKPYEGLKYGEILPITQTEMEDQATDMVEVINDFYIDRCIFTENYNSINGDGVNPGLLDIVGVNTKTFTLDNTADTAGYPIRKRYAELPKLISDNLKPQYEVNAAMYVNSDGLLFLETIKGSSLERDKDGDLCFSKYKVFVLGADELPNVDTTKTNIIIGDLKRAGTIISSNLKIATVSDFVDRNLVHMFRPIFMTISKIVNTEAYFVVQADKVTIA